MLPSGGGRAGATPAGRTARGEGRAGAAAEGAGREGRGPPLWQQRCAVLGLAASEGARCNGSLHFPVPQLRATLLPECRGQSSRLPAPLSALPCGPTTWPRCAAGHWAGGSLSQPSFWECTWLQRWPGDLMASGHRRAWGWRAQAHADTRSAAGRKGCPSASRVGWRRPGRCQCHCATAPPSPLRSSLHAPACACACTCACRLAQRASCGCWMRILTGRWQKPRSWLGRRHCSSAW